MTRGGAVVPLRFGLGLVLIATLLLAMASFGDTGPWPDGATTTGQVTYVQDRWSSRGGSARVTYEVDGIRYERWLPDFDEQGRVQVGDPYLLEYKTGDPTQARGVAANRDDIVFGEAAFWSGLAAAFLAVGVVVLHLAWREPPDDPSDGPAPRRAR